ncbi:MAG: hypothetical protein RIQ33_890 [Bacteroidota bacterium]|jgi:hypothetical protein
MQMQDVNFKSVHQFLEYLPLNEFEITTTLRQIVLETGPTIHEKLSWNIPTYSVHKSICFIWPASIKWGKKSSYTGVRFGFSYGNLLANHQNYFELGNRKQVAFKTFKHVNEIDVKILKSALLEAIFIDEQMALTKKMNHFKSRK